MTRRLNKRALIGLCSRLPVRVDAAKLAADVAAIPATAWPGADGRVGVHNQVQAIFLRGYAPAEGDKPIVDRQTLRQLPYVRSILDETIPAPPARCLLARLPPRCVVARHKDQGDYFAEHLRLHFPVVTNPDCHMLCGDRIYPMQPGEVWALNNSGALHAVSNNSETLARTHLICDFVPTPALIALLNDAERDLGSTR